MHHISTTITEFHTQIVASWCPPPPPFRGSLTAQFPVTPSSLFGSPLWWWWCPFFCSFHLNWSIYSAPKLPPPCTRSTHPALLDFSIYLLHVFSILYLIIFILFYCFAPLLLLFFFLFLSLPWMPSSSTFCSPTPIAEMKPADDAVIRPSITVSFYLIYLSLAQYNWFKLISFLQQPMWSILYELALGPLRSYQKYAIQFFCVDLAPARFTVSTHP